MKLVVRPLGPADRSGWDVLARGYKAFYGTNVPDEDYERVWRRLMDDGVMHGLGATENSRLIGISHHLFHDNLWLGRVCYLQDMFVDPASRGRGVARALIEHVADEARAAGASRLYWQTKQDNAVARAMYDKVARFNGFIRYDYPL